MDPSTLPPEVLEELREAGMKALRKVIDDRIRAAAQEAYYDMWREVMWGKGVRSGGEAE